MNAFLIARRDVASYLHGFTGYTILALVLFVTGALFQVRGLGTGAAYSHEVLESFFENCGGLVMVASILITMRSLAEERQLGTDVLLLTSPTSEGTIVAGKYLSAMIIMTAFLGLTAYMPALIFVNGKVSLVHILVGYLGLLCLASSTISMGIAASSLFRNQLPAGVLAAAIVVVMLLGWRLADELDPPFSDVMAYAAYWDKHFTAFMEGRLHLRSVVYYLTISFGFLLGATKVLEGRRWR